MPQDRILLDVHAHLVPIRLDLIAAFDGVVWDQSLRRLTIDGQDLAYPAVYQPSELIAWMDANTIETAWISVPPPVYRAELPEDKTAAWVEYLNDGLLAIAADHPARL